MNKKKTLEQKALDYALMKLPPRFTKLRMRHKDVTQIYVRCDST